MKNIEELGISPWPWTCGTNRSFATVLDGYEGKGEKPMIYQTYIDRNGNPKKKVLRNCDRCANIQDAKGKFRAECDGDGNQFYKRISEWLMEEAR